MLLKYWMKQTGAVASKISNEFHARTSRALANIDRSRVCMRFGKSLAPTAAFLSLSSFSVRRSVRAVRETKCKNGVCLAWRLGARKKHTSEQINSDRSWREPERCLPRLFSRRPTRTFRCFVLWVLGLMCLGNARPGTQPWNAKWHLV